jgi:hypothetical protein
MTECIVASVGVAFGQLRVWITVFPLSFHKNAVGYGLSE